MSQVYLLRPSLVTVLAVQRRLFHRSVVVRRAKQEPNPPPIAPEETQSQEDEVVLFSQDKDILPEVEVKPFQRIKEDSNLRFSKRIIQPSLEWYKKTEDVNAKQDGHNYQKPLSLMQSDIPSTVLFQESIKWLAKGSYQIEQKENKADQIDPSKISFHIKPSSILSSTLMCGDLCVIKNRPFELVVCVGTPSESMDGRFTFAKADGTIKYARKEHVVVRFPNIFKTSNLNLLQRETQHGYTPIGTTKNDKDITFIIPTLARRMLISNITFSISNKANEQLPVVKKKLELLHRYLQSGIGSWQIPFLKLVELCTHLDLSQDIDKAVSKALHKSGLDSKSLYSLADSHFKLTSNIPQSVDCSLFLAVYWAILHQQGTQMWGEVTVHKGLFFPSAVTILPLGSQYLHYHNTIHKLRQFDGKRISKIAELINSNSLALINEKFPYIIPLLRDYAAGNLQYNETITSLIASLFRKLDKYKDHNVSRDSCFDLLKQINPAEPPNPLLVNQELQLPNNNERVKLEQKIYDLTVPPNFQSQENNRIEYENLVCYCIDSPEAHEIDDAVSITKLGASKYRLYIHVADPASLFPESMDTNITSQSPVLDIAYQRAFTTYLPDKVFPMLPVSFARKSDLGAFGKPTRAMTFSIECELSQNGNIRLLNDSLKIELSIVHKSKRTTYDKVDSVLGKKSESVQSQEQQDLFSLFKIAKALRKKRIQEGGAVVFENSSNGLVRLTTDDNSDLTVVSFEDQKESKSTILVSELMILANTIAASYFKEAKIPGIFRAYRKLNLVDEAASLYEWMETKTKNNEIFSQADITKIANFMTNSFYSSTSIPHSMIGSQQYLTVTSPLRRFPDMINHIQLHRHLRNLPLFYSQSDLDGMAWHIMTRDVTLKNASHKAQSFWTLKYLKDTIKDPSKNFWSIRVTHLPEDGYVRCVIKDKSFATGKLKLNLNQKPLLVGDTVSACRISRIECLDGNLEFELTPKSKTKRLTSQATKL